LIRCCDGKHIEVVLCRIAGRFPPAAPGPKPQAQSEKK
jgi:hypothetical protein